MSHYQNRRVYMRAMVAEIGNSTLLKDLPGPWESISLGSACLSGVSKLWGSQSEESQMRMIQGVRDSMPPGSVLTLSHDSSGRQDETEIMTYYGQREVLGFVALRLDQMHGLIDMNGKWDTSYLATLSSTTFLRSLPKFPKERNVSSPRLNYLRRTLQDYLQHLFFLSNAFLWSRRISACVGTSTSPWLFYANHTGHYEIRPLPTKALTIVRLAALQSYSQGSLDHFEVQSLARRFLDRPLKELLWMLEIAEKPITTRPRKKILPLESTHCTGLSILERTSQGFR